MRGSEDGDWEKGRGGWGARRERERDRRRSHLKMLANLPGFKKTPWTSVEEVKQDGDRTEYTVKFGRFRSCSFGDKISSKPVTTGVGGDAVKWKAVFFPKGECMNS